MGLSGASITTYGALYAILVSFAIDVCYFVLTLGVFLSVHITLHLIATYETWRVILI